MASSAVFELAIALKNEASGGLGGLISQAGAFAAGGFIQKGIEAVTGGITDLVGSAISEASEWQTQLGQLDAVLTSTGGKAGITRDALLDMAGALSAGGGFSAAADDAVLQGQNMLLTFTNIGKDVFPDASRAMLDMATKMNGGVTPAADQLSQQAVQLGKALNDPEKGISALSRVGVTFTQQQKDQIKAMVEAGNTMGAQKLILSELNSEFGGSATAAMNSFAGQQQLVSEQFNNLKQSLGEKLMPVFSQVMGFIGSPAVMGVLQGLVNGVGIVIDKVMSFASAIGQLLSGDGAAFQQFFSDLGGPMGAVGDFITNIVANFRGFIDAISSGKDPIAALGDLIGGNLGAAGNLLEDVLNWVTNEGLPAFINKLGEWGGALIGWIGESLPGWMQAAGDFLGQALAWVGEQVPKWLEVLGGWAGAFVGWVLESLPGWLAAAGEFIGSALKWVVEQIPGWVAKLAEWGKAFIDWLLPQLPGWLAKAGEFIGKILGWVLEQIPKIAGQLLQWAGEFLGWLLPHLPEMLANLGDFLIAIGNWIITEALPAIVTKLGEWAKAFLDWVGTSVLPFIGGKLAELWTAITTWITNTAKDIWTKVQEIGKNIVEGVKQGILGAWEAFTGWLGGMFQGAVDGIKEFLGISSPSRLLADEVGNPMVAGVQAGWAAGFPGFYNEVIAGMDRLVGEVAARAAQIAQMQANVTATGSAVAGGGVGMGDTSGGVGGNTGGVQVLDTGGIVRGPRLAALAMDGRPEAVIPLDRLDRMLGGGGGRPMVTVNINGPVVGMDEQALARYIAEILYDNGVGRN